MAPQAENGTGSDAFCADPWVITFERVFIPGETTLMDICETYEDVLQKYGCIHLPGLVRKVCRAEGQIYISVSMAELTLLTIGRIIAGHGQ